jgi:transcriptional regulator with XRE-family HTH domain
LNEMLRRALLKARVSEEDVATRLDVDPKTVRRWLEGRIPYLRHRWALASMLGLDETYLWPQVGTARLRPDEVRAIYRNWDAVPSEVWLCFLSAADREIDILEDTGAFLADEPELLATLRDRTRAGIRVRICLRHSDIRGPDDAVARIRHAFAPCRRPRDRGDVEIRVHQVMLNNVIYRADDQLLIGQRAFGIAAWRAPVLHLHRTYSGVGHIVATYLESFDRIWASALPIA